MNTTMPDYVSRTVQDLESRIEVLVGARDSLMALFPEDGTEATAGTNTRLAECEEGKTEEPMARRPFDTRIFPVRKAKPETSLPDRSEVTEAEPERGPAGVGPQTALARNPSEREMRGVFGKSVAILQKLPQPFTAEAASVATGLTVEQTRNLLFRLKSRNWLAMPERGEYERTKHFPADLARE